ncbi:MAG: SpoIIE family protein phosphatase [Clostridia bacterium]|nr:SpoIIE family protein phosphatase [Clostridia bacterium]
MTRQKVTPEGRAAADTRSVGEVLLYHAVFLALGMLLGSAELFLGVYPFGLALSAAAGGYLPAVAGGVLLVSLFAERYPLSLAVIALVLLRALISVCTRGRRSVREALFCERLSYRVTVAAVVALGQGVFALVTAGFRFYELFGVLLAVAAAPLACFLYLGFFLPRDKLFRGSFEVGLGAVIMTGIFALRAVSFFGIYPAAVIAAAVALLLASHRGVLVSTIGGALAGLCFDFRLAPAFLLVAVGFSLLQKSSRGGGVAAGASLATAYAYLIYRESGILLLLPSLLVAGALFLAFDSAGLVEGAPARHLLLSRRRAAGQLAGAARERYGREKISSLSGAFLDLSSTFYELSARTRRPGAGELKRLCDKAFESVCAGCRNRELCWGERRAESLSAVEEMARRLYERGALTVGMAGGALATRCNELPRIVSVINNGAVALAEEALNGDKTAVVATDYAAMGRLLADTIAEGEAAFSCDTAAGERIFARLLRMGYGLEAVAVCGKTHGRVILRGVRTQGRSPKLREIRTVVERHCGFAPGEARVTQSEGLCDIVFEERRTLSVKTVKLTRPKSARGSAYCGDSVAALIAEEGMAYSFICDGMGSGKEAALTSALASVFLSRFLQAGSRAEGTLRMLNGFLAARSRTEGECSTTVDLLEIDLVGGEAALYKCGAAATFLLRDGKASRFFSHTAPVGILEALDAERIGFTVQPGDLLVQVSDGFTLGEEDCPWLADMLERRYDGDTEAFARLALNRASGKNDDDLSVIITEVGAAAAVGSTERETA